MIPDLLSKTCFIFWLIQLSNTAGAILLFCGECQCRQDNCFSPTTWCFVSSSCAQSLALTGKQGCTMLEAKLIHCFDFSLHKDFPWYFLLLAALRGHAKAGHAKVVSDQLLGWCLEELNSV